ncbi:MAG: DnaA regulatory inactivator Hda [Casimicrobiaceae bacterium]
MAEQLVFALVEEEPPTFANFVAVGNAEAVAALKRAARAGAGSDAIALWGVEGGGKSHLLRAFVAEAASAGRSARYLSEPAQQADATDVDCLAIDNIDRADVAAQARLFTLFNALRERGGQWVSASRGPAAQGRLRDDLRTRLGWGLTFEVRALDDAAKPAALAAHARQRGLVLGDDVIAYMLAHGRRDMRSLMAALVAVDRHSLSTRRPVSVVLVREWMARETPTR